MLAEKIATAVAAGIGATSAGAVGAGAAPAVAMSMANSSSLGEADATAIYEAVGAALRARRFQVTSPAPKNSVGTRVLVTFSEDASHYLFVAQVWTTAARDGQVAIVSAPKLTERGGAAAQAFVTLSRKIIWSQPGEILDFTPLQAPVGAAALAVLEPERVGLYDPSASGWNLDHFVQVAHVRPWPRDVSGSLDATNGQVTMERLLCGGDFFHADGVHCDQARQASRAGEQESAAIEGQGSDAARVGIACQGLGSLVITSGAGDWTEPDDLQAYDASSAPPQAVSQPLALSGPVMMMEPMGNGQSVRVVSRNLQTGMYEASIVTIACGN